MSAKEEMFDLFVTLSPKAENIIQRIMNLSDEQLDLFIALYSQQETESCQPCRDPRLTSA